MTTSSMEKKKTKIDYQEKNFLIKKKRKIEHVIGEGRKYEKSNKQKEKEKNRKIFFLFERKNVKKTRGGEKKSKKGEAFLNRWGNEMPNY